jgi:hypothetical protein
MIVPIQVDRRTGKAVKVLDNPRFVLARVVAIKLDADGRVGEVRYGESSSFGRAEWENVVTAKGDFSVIGIHLVRGKSIANFGEYRDNSRNSLRMK